MEQTGIMLILSTDSIFYCILFIQKSEHFIFFSILLVSTCSFVDFLFQEYPRIFMFLILARKIKLVESEKIRTSLHEFVIFLAPLTVTLPNVRNYVFLRIFVFCILNVLFFLKVRLLY